MSQSNSILDRSDVQKHVIGWIEDGETNSSIVLKLKEVFNLTSSEKSIRRFRKRHGTNPRAFDQSRTVIDGDEGYIVTPPTTVAVLQDPDTMIRQRGLDPEEWAIADGMRVNQYEGPAPADSPDNKITYYQTRFNIVRKNPSLQIMAPRTDGYIYERARGRYATPEEGRILCVVVGDQQAPYHEPDLHDAFCAWLEVNQPDWGVSLGDTFDFPDIRPGHRFDPENTATVNECLQGGYDLFRDYREASVDTWWRKLIGNHDERLRNILLDVPKVRGLYGIKRPDTPEGPGENLHALSHAARLDELDVEVIDPHGAYDLAQLVLTPKLAVRHGWIARKGSGTSALETLKHLGFSVIVGHTHRQSVIHESKHEIDGEIRTLTGVETGCMCRVKQTIGEDGRIWPNYTVSPDWQQGFATVEIWPDGYFNIDTAKFVNGTLMWRDQRY